MSKENLERFCLFVLGNAELQAELKDLEDRRDFIGKVVALGADNGFRFESGDVELLMRENRRVWSQKWI